MMDWTELAGGSTVIAGATAALTRWLTARSVERRDTITQLLERIARVEGRADEQSRMLSHAQQALADERVRHSQEIAALQARLSEQDHRIAQLEGERDEALAAAERLRTRRLRSSTPSQAWAPEPGED